MDEETPKDKQQVDLITTRDLLDALTLVWHLTELGEVHK